MRYSFIISTAIAVGIATVRASPLHLIARAEEAKISPYITCMRQKHPSFPKGDTPTPEEIRNCIDKPLVHAKRAEASTNLEEGFDTKLIYEPSTSSDVKARGIIDTIQVLGKSIGLDKKAECPHPGKLGNEFEWAKDIQVKANEICRKLREQIDGSGLSQDGGVGLVIDALSGGHNKRGHQVQDDRKLLATYTLNFIPPAKMAIDEIKQVASGVYDLCNDGIERITSKGDGCAVDVNYYRPSKMKHYTDAASADGSIRMFFGNYYDTVASLQVDFTEDN